MTQLWDELGSPLNIYALAVVISCVTATLAALVVKTSWPSTQTLPFCMRFTVAALFFKTGYSAYEAIVMTHQLTLAVLDIPDILLLLLFSFVMTLCMLLFDFRSKIRNMSAAGREAARIVAQAQEDLEKSNGSAHRSGSPSKRP